MGMEDMTGLVSPIEEEEAVRLGWGDVGAAGAENTSPVEGLRLCVSLEGRIRKKKIGKT